MDIDQEVRARIEAAADKLYAEGGRAVIPTVDQVRRASRADMNAVSAVMKEWRRMQTVVAPAPAAAIPEKLRVAVDSAIALVWAEAQGIANEALQNAQTTFATERAEAEAIREELSLAFQAQGGELERATAVVEALQSTNADLASQVANLTSSLAALTEQHDQATTRARIAEERAAELTKRVEDLNRELQRSHLDAESLRKERDGASARAEQSERQAAATTERLLAAQAELATVRADLTHTKAQAERDATAAAEAAKRSAADVSTANQARDAANAVASQAREAAAESAGKLAELTRQVEALTKTLADKPAGRKDK